MTDYKMKNKKNHHLSGAKASVFFTLIPLLLFFPAATSQVSINTDGSAPDNSAILDLKSNTKGFLMPRMTSGERDAILNCVDGLMVYCNSDNNIWFNSQNEWRPLLISSDDDWTITSDNLYNTQLKSVSIGSGNIEDWVTLDVSGRVWQSGFGNSLYFGKGAGNADNGSTNLNNTCLGFNAGYSQSLGKDNVFVGAYAGEDADEYGRHVAIGAYAMKNATACSDNTAIGYNCMLHVNTGSYNTSIGSGNLIWGGAYNTANYNTTIGHVNSSLYNTSSNSTAFGYDTKYTASNQVRIGNSSVTSIGGYTDWSNISDKRFKTNISDNVPGLDFILRLRAVSYSLNHQLIDKIFNNPISDNEQDPHINSTNKKQSPRFSGFIPQEVEATARFIGYDFSGIDPPKNETDLYGLRYATFVMPLIKAVQEQQALIEELEAIADQRDKEIAELEAQIYQLE